MYSNPQAVYARVAMAMPTRTFSRLVVNYRPINRVVEALSAASQPEEGRRRFRRRDLFRGPGPATDLWQIPTIEAG